MINAFCRKGFDGLLGSVIDGVRDVLFSPWVVVSFYDSIDTI